MTFSAERQPPALTRTMPPESAEAAGPRSLDSGGKAAPLRRTMSPGWFFPGRETRFSVLKRRFSSANHHLLTWAVHPGILCG